eukprot:7390723-Prymnesium_polylepis.1
MHHRPTDRPVAPSRPADTPPGGRADRHRPARTLPPLQVLCGRANCMERLLMLAGQPARVSPSCFVKPSCRRHVLHVDVARARVELFRITRRVLPSDGTAVARRRGIERHRYHTPRKRGIERHRCRTPNDEPTRGALLHAKRWHAAALGSARGRAAALTRP